MARIELAPEVFDDFDRFLDYMAEVGSIEHAPRRIDELIAAVDILAQSPLMGRKVKDGMRELVIGRSSNGYVALYRYLPSIDTVFVLALRSQREVGFKRDA